jgi:hypothetical protein
MAISKPTKLPEWASTTANVVEPSEGKKDDGWLVNEIPPSSYENWRAKKVWEWWRWWDEKVDEGATDEDLKINGSVAILTGSLALTNASALEGVGKGSYPGIVGVTGDQDWDKANQKVGVMGLAGTGTTSGAFTDVGVLGTDDAFGGDASNVGVVGHSTTKIGVAGVVNNIDLTGGTFSNVGVIGMDSTFTGTVGSFGVFGYSNNKAGVLGIGGAGSLGSATITDCGLVGVGDNTVPSGTYSDIGVFGCGTWGGRFLGAGSSDIGVAGSGGSGTIGGIGGNFSGGSSTSGAGGKAIDADGGSSTSGDGGIGIDSTGGQGSSTNVGGIGVKGTGGALTSTDGGRGAEFYGGGSVSNNYDGGDGLYSKGGIASGATNTKGGYGAVLEGSDASTTAARTPLRLVPSTVDPPSAENEAGAIFTKGGKLYYHDGSGWKELATV